MGKGGGVAVSIFVNPGQFDRGEDFASYPRTLKADAEALRHLNAVDYLYAPKAESVYPKDWKRRYEVPSRLGDCLCGRRRPSHFQAVADVVERLFTLTKPRLAVFGEKDYQQLLIIQDMARGLEVKIVPHPVVRQADGLAHSSRNTYLSKAEREAAPNLYRVMRIIAQTTDIWRNKERPLAWGVRTLEAKGFKVEYLELRRAQTLEVAHGPPARLFAAAFLGGARLIDNIAVG